MSNKKEKFIFLRLKVNVKQCSVIKQIITVMKVNIHTVNSELRYSHRITI